MPVNPAYCIDIYGGDTVLGDEDEGFAQVKSQGIAFLDHKLTQGTTFKDSLAAFRTPRWLAGGPVAVTDVDKTILWLEPRIGFYHFNGTGLAKDEATWFITNAKPLWSPGVDLTLDWEDIGASGTQQPASWADEFCNRVEDAFGFSIKVYGGDTPREQLPKASSAILDRFASRRFWFCQYGNFDPADVAVPWQGKPDCPFQWQDDGDAFGPGRHTIPGISGYCDNSTVVGTMTVAKLASQWGGGLKPASLGGGEGNAPEGIL